MDAVAVMGVRDSVRRGESLLVLVMATCAGLSPVALVVECWWEGAVLIACGALAAVGVSRDTVLFIAGLWLYVVVACHVLFWLFYSGGRC